jgi:hypothetical protein
MKGHALGDDHGLQVDRGLVHLLIVLGRVVAAEQRPHVARQRIVQALHVF